MTIDEKMCIIVSELVESFGTEHIVTYSEICLLMSERYGTNPASVIPSDHCYNRVNRGITINKPMLFEYLGNSEYRCLGEHYPYNGDVYHRSRENGYEIIVGKCINGVRDMFCDLI